MESNSMRFHCVLEYTDENYGNFIGHANDAARIPYW